MTTDDDSGADDDGSSNSGGALFDVGSGDGTESAGGTQDGCEKIDFLFVIDNSISMAGAQASLVASFPGFIQTISDVVGTNDYHILVTDSDWGGGANLESNVSDCTQSCTINPLGSCHNEPCSNLGCDGTLGAGKTVDQAENDCGFATDDRYILPEQNDLAATFACVAEVGIDGSASERVMEATVRAVTREVEPGGCNDGFLRDDAILVVVLITDEPHDSEYPAGGPADWAQSLIDAKGGNPDAIVALAVVNDYDVPGAVCSPSRWFDPGILFREWAETFPYGQWASVCNADYSPFFTDAVAIIDTACDEFTPAG